MDELRCALELRDAEGSPGLLSGVLLTYGEVSPSHRELFEPGALSWPADGIVLNRSHNATVPIMRVMPRVQGDEVRIDALLPDTAAGRDAAQEVRDGLFRGLSVEFKATRAFYHGGLRRIQAAQLRGAGLVSDPSYTGSTVSVRARRRDSLLAWL